MFDDKKVGKTTYLPGSRWANIDARRRVTKRTRSAEIEYMLDRYDEMRARENAHAVSMAEPEVKTQRLQTQTLMDDPL